VVEVAKLIQQESRLKVADQHGRPLSSSRSAVKGGSHRRYARVGDIVTADREGPRRRRARSRRARSCRRSSCGRRSRTPATTGR
jgi:ribosomal protein L14